MADVADQIFASAQEVSTGEVQNKNMGAVADLVGKMQGVATQRAQIEEMKQKMEEAKLTKFVDAIEKGKAFKGSARNNYYQKFLPRMRDSLGLTDKFPDESLAFMTADEDNLNRVSRMVALINEGKMEGSRALEIANDPVKFAEISGLPVEQTSAPLSAEERAELQEAGKFSVSELGKTQRTQMTTDAAAGRLATNIAAAGPKALATKTADEYSTYTNAGGAATIKSNIKTIQSVIDDLDKNAIETGTARSFVPTSAGQKIFNAKVLSAQARAHKAIQASLRATLGSQFTEGEGKRILENTFDPQLSNKENISRLNAEIEKIKETKANAERSFQEQGFMSRKSQSSGSEINANPSFVKVAADALRAGRSEAEIVASLQRRGKSEAEINAILEAARGN